MTVREPIGKRQRFEIFKRDRFCCTYCGKKPPEVMLEIDHVVPVASGGTNDPANLVAACQACNRGKGATGLEAIISGVDETLLLEAVQEAMERAAMHQRSIAAKQLEMQAVDDVARQVADYWPWNVTDRFPPDLPSIRRFIREGMTYWELIDLMDVVGAKVSGGYLTHADAWRYFCGAAWGEIRRAG